MEGEKEMMNSTVVINLTDREQHQLFLYFVSDNFFPRLFILAASVSTLLVLKYDR
jgi:hypothetical protein